MPKALPLVDITAPACCAPLAAGPMSDDDALRLALRLKALADPARVKIMSLLFSSSAGEENTSDLAAVVELTESTVSHHLGQVRVNNSEKLLKVGFGIGFDLLRREWFTRFFSATGITQARRPVPNDHNGLMPQLLKLAQFAEDNGMANRQVIVAGIYAQFDAQRLPLIAFQQQPA